MQEIKAHCEVRHIIELHKYSDKFQLAVEGRTAEKKRFFC